MIIQLEGPDGSGKSTLARAIKEALYEMVPVWYDNIEYIIPTKPTAKDRLNEKELFKRLVKIAKSKTVYILDRGPISDVIYRVFDSYNSVTTLPKIIKFFEEHVVRCFVVFCGTPLAEEKMLERGEDNPTSLNRHKELTKVYNIVEDCFKATIPFNIKHFDYSKNKCSSLISDIEYWTRLLTENNK